MRSRLSISLAMAMLMAISAAGAITLAQEPANVTGAVVIAATIDDHGKVIQMTAISGPEMLHGAALAALRQWTYKPYLLNGAPVFVSTMVTVVFPRTR